MAELNLCPGEVNVAWKNPKVACIDGIRDLLSTVPIAPSVLHGLRDLLGRNEVFLHQRKFFAGIVGEQIVHGFLDFLLLKTERGGAVSLRVQVHQQHLCGRQPLAAGAFCEGSGHVDGRGRFRTTALLVGDGDDHFVRIHLGSPPAHRPRRTSPFNASLGGHGIRRVESQERELQRGFSGRCACP